MTPRSLTARRSLTTRLGVIAAAALLVALPACGDDDGDTTTTTAAAAGDAELTISDVWARAAEDLTASDRSAVYMVITGGDVDDALLTASVPSDIAATTEVHETVAAEDGTTTTDGMESDGMESDGMESETTTGMDGDGMDGMDGDDTGGMSGMMQMREVSRIDIPAGTTVTLEPGGYHVMLLELAAPLTPGQTFEVTLTFEVAGERTVTAEVRQP